MRLFVVKHEHERYMENELHLLADLVTNFSMLECITQIDLKCILNFLSEKEQEGGALSEKFLKNFDSQVVLELF